MADPIIVSEALKSLRGKWKTYGRRDKSDEQNLNWLMAYQDLLREAGISRYLALHILKGDV